MVDSCKSSTKALITSIPCITQEIWVKAYRQKTANEDKKYTAVFRAKF